MAIACLFFVVKVEMTYFSNSKLSDRYLKSSDSPFAQSEGYLVPGQSDCTVRMGIVEDLVENEHGIVAQFLVNIAESPVCWVMTS